MIERTDSTIDFVLPWVDGADSAWLKQLKEYTLDSLGDKKVNRYRDWDNLHYLFRGIEKFAPWVRYVHFVTWGHIPEWLDVTHPKIKIVRHEDFLDKDNLPIFNSHAIEVNLHRIPDLSEQFVYFNDDTFLLKSVSSERFFKNGKPRDIFSLNALTDSKIAHIKINDHCCIHRYFDKKEVLKKNFFKIFNLKYGAVQLMKTMLLLPWPKFTGFFDHHMPQAFLKSTFSEVWERERGVLERTSASRVRSSYDVNQYLFRYWHLCKGQFVPIGFSQHCFSWVGGVVDAEKCSILIRSKRMEMVCLNDSLELDCDFEKVQAIINSAFEQVLPEKSSFELPAN